MLSADNIAANRKTLTDLLINQMNLPAAFSDWTYSQRVDFNKAFAAYVLAHPTSFGEQDAQSANIVTAEAPSQLSDDSYSAQIGTFIDAAAQEARAINPLDSMNIGTVGKNLLIAAVVLGAVYIIVKNWPKGPHPVAA